jgi:transcriptional regulatory protein RtcR
MSTLFGHIKGAYTGALTDRPGLLRKANGGLLFLDEIGELGLDEQAMLLRAIEHKVFYPVGADKEVRSDFQLIAGTNRDLLKMACKGKFRADLVARIHLWTFRLPGLRERPTDIEPNLAYELDAASKSLGRAVTMSREARESFLRFATGPSATWAANFRDLNAAVVRMSTLAAGGRITPLLVKEETQRLLQSWGSEPCDRADETTRESLVEKLLGKTQAEELDRFDRVQLEDVLRVCLSSSSLSEAGRILFAHSRAKRTSVNDADRLRKYLARFGLTAEICHTPITNEKSQVG